MQIIIAIITLIVTKLLLSINLALETLKKTNETLVINHNLKNPYFTDIRYQTNKPAETLALQSADILIQQFSL